MLQAMFLTNSSVTLVLFSSVKVLKSHTCFSCLSLNLCLKKIAKLVFHGIVDLLSSGIRSGEINKRRCLDASSATGANSLYSLNCTNIS